MLGERFEAPRVADGVIWRVLEDLLMLDGERLSYRALDVEQVGSVYESMMGFDVRTLPGRAIAVRPKRVVFDVDALLAVPGGKRAAWLDLAKLTGNPAMKSENVLLDGAGRVYVTAGDAYDFQQGAGGVLYRATPLAPRRS